MKRPHRRRPAQAAAPSVEPPRIRRYALLLLMAGAIVYANSLSNPFILDDTAAIVENPSIRQLWPPGVPLSPPDETPVARRPLVNLSFAINYAAGGLDVRGYHGVNLAIHLIAALILFGVIRRGLLMGGAESVLTRHATRVAGASAFIWMLHPIQTEVVNYVTQRTSSLMGLCYLLTLYCSIRSLGARSPRWQTAAVLACAAGMAAKESMVTAPVMVLLLDVVLTRRSVRDAVGARSVMYAGLAGTWVLLAVLMSSGVRSTAGFSSAGDAWVYLLNQLPLIAHYLRLFVWPMDLVVDYGVPAPLTITDVVGPALLVTAAAGLSIAALVRWPRAGALGVAFFLLLAPTSSIVPIATEVGAERRMYLPLASLTLLLACAAWQAGAAAIRAVPSIARLHPGTRAVRLGAGAVFGLIVVLLALGTIVRNEEYSSPRTLTQTIVDRRPHGRAYFALGHAFFEEGDRDQALAFFHRAADTGTFPEAHFALGTEFIGDREFDRGIAELQTFVRLAPDHLAAPSAHQLLATALAIQGRLPEAAEELRLVEAAGALNGRSQALFGEVLLRLNQDAEAIQRLEAAVQLSPRDVRTRNLLGSALARRGQVAAAAAHFRRATEIDPGFQPARENLAAAERLLATR